MGLDDDEDDDDEDGEGDEDDDYDEDEDDTDDEGTDEDNGNEDPGMTLLDSCVSGITKFFEPNSSIAPRDRRSTRSRPPRRN